ncbi:DUF397 domain-containing protein [Catenuloplanes nepalensis]|uniref:DUF397 domain-containing protein n=1 Tax=Catenuloplanes nepalensis TaxID=587533 RepID=UPI0027D8D490|nr:DUF397 domain-containing protein [Catenuloplanes nepalensis]
MTVSNSPWIKASRCQMEQCVEVRPLGSSGARVRDSKQQPGGPVLAFTEAGWAAFVGGLKNDAFGGSRA